MQHGGNGLGGKGRGLPGRLCRTDSRLSFDYQCYGGMDYIEVQAAAGTLENSLIWVPDIELYNNAEAIWGEAVLGARLASVYSCWDGAPNRSITRARSSSSPHRCRPRTAQRCCAGGRCTDSRRLRVRLLEPARRADCTLPLHRLAQLSERWSAHAATHSQLAAHSLPCAQLPSFKCPPPNQKQISCDRFHSDCRHADLITMLISS